VIPAEWFHVGPVGGMTLDDLKQYENESLKFAKSLTSFDGHPPDGHGDLLNKWLDSPGQLILESTNQYTAILSNEQSSVTTQRGNS
jgi:hypothetical protein